MQKATIDWKCIGDDICAVLTDVYVNERQAFAKEAKRRHITVEQLAAAALTTMVQTLVEKPARADPE